MSTLLGQSRARRAPRATRATRASRATATTARLAPWLTLALLLGLSRGLPTSVRDEEAAAARRAEIASAMESVPFFLGPWVGRDEEVPPEAQKLLRPSAIFSRTYRKGQGTGVHVLLVHCSDARDMIGHYPPVCYPSAGWVRGEVNGGGADALTIDGTRVPVRLYRFRRTGERGRSDEILVLNAFILPGGSVTPEISDINRLSERRAVSARGVAQLQVIAPAALGSTDAIEAAEELLSSMHDLLAALQVGQGGTGEN